MRRKYQVGKAEKCPEREIALGTGSAEWPQCSPDLQEGRAMPHRSRRRRLTVLVGLIVWMVPVEFGGAPLVMERMVELAEAQAVKQP